MSKFDGILKAKSTADIDSYEKTAEIGLKLQKKAKPKRVGKRSNPDFTQITAYVKKDTHEAVMRRIYKELELSELIEGLLSNWLNEQD
jgi:CO dehydrogenase/acetyl-CoA synthase alpha subunit